jgi:uncharacterized protein YggE
MTVPGSGASTTGITVTGRATVSIPPDRLSIVVRLFPRNVTYAALDELATTVAAAMRSAGVADAHVALPVLGNLGQNSTAAIVGTVQHPTREALETIMRSTLKAIPDATATALQNGYQIQTSLAVDDCTAAEKRAQNEAFADAKARAAGAAAAAGVALGAVVAINESGIFPSPACRRQGEEGAVTINAGDAYGPFSVPIAVNLVVTFALR